MHDPLVWPIESSSQPALFGINASGYIRNLRTDDNGNLSTNLATKLAGEDINSDVMKVEQQYNSSRITTNTATVVKTGTGMLHKLSFQCAVPGNTQGVIRIYDNTANSGTLIDSLVVISGVTYDKPFEFTYDTKFTTGLCVETAGLTNFSLNTPYR
jgi:hypothetical protein